METEPLVLDVQAKRRLFAARAVLVCLVVLLVALGAWARGRFVEPVMRKNGTNRIIQRLEPKLRSGDLLFQISRSGQAAAIAKATGSPWTHCGLVFHRQGRWQVLEASSKVQWTPLAEWIAQGKDLSLEVRRVDSTVFLPDPAGLASMEQSASRYGGKPYDLVFGWSDSAIYCSELPWKVYRAIGVDLGMVQSLRQLNLSSSEVKDLIQRRSKLGIRWEDSLVTPAGLRNSPRLHPVSY
ncbi:MAG: hypothetical protein IPK50_11425 [Fibrobacterota bacterium]|nr:hypothetical protein [Fibrobacterota bacterium]QQS07484.1 MAG: hypothetical protein IPK50_11425 [Fibrobacterota bacterium]